MSEQVLTRQKEVNVPKRRRNPILIKTCYAEGNRVQYKFSRSPVTTGNGLTLGWGH